MEVTEAESKALALKRPASPTREEDESRKKSKTYTEQAHEMLDKEPESIRFDPTSYLYYGITEHYAVECKIPESQSHFLEEFQLFRPQMAKWLATYETNARYDEGVKDSIAHYIGSYSDKFYAWYNLDKPAGGLPGWLSRGQLEAFDAVWNNPKVFRFLPKGAIVFEGQTRDKDMVHLRQGSVLQRKRPSSTSWQLNVGLYFATAGGALQYAKAKDLRPTLLVHEMADDFVRAIYVPKQLQPSDQVTEFEVMLQPGLRIEVVRVIPDYDIDVHSITRMAHAITGGPVTVKFTRVTRL